MDLLRKLTKRNLSLNKKRSIVTIIGIMLSVALIFTVLGMVSSLRETMKNIIIADEGNYHIKTEENQLENILKNNKDVRDLSKISLVGYVNLYEDNSNYYKYLIIKALDDNAIKNNTIKLIEGRLPENDGEIILYSDFKYNDKHSYKLNEIINEDISARVLDGDYLFNEYYEEEKLMPINKKEYKIVGFFDHYSNSIINYSEPGLPGITKYDSSNEYINETMFYRLDNLNKLGDHENAVYGNEYSYSENSDLLKLSGYGFSNSTMKILVRLATIISLIIVVTSVFVIRNSFAISTVEKTKQYGILKSLGATNKQIKNDILFEGFYLGSIGIVLGLILGFIVNKILIFVLNHLMGENFLGITSGLGFVSKISILGILISILLSVITIYLSSMYVARRVKKLSPIEAIKGNRDIKINPKDVKVPKFIDNIFGISGLISYKNMKRNKKKFRTTTFSIILSITIFISMFSFVNILKKSMDLEFSEINFTLSTETFNSDIDHNKNFEGNKKMVEYLNLKDPYTIFKKIDLVDLEGEYDYENDYNKSLVILDSKSFLNLLKENNLTEESKALVNKEYKKITYDENDAKHIQLEETNLQGLKEFEHRQFIPSDNGTDGEFKLIKKLSFNLTPIEKSLPGFPSIPEDTAYIFIEEGSIDESDLKIWSSGTFINTNNDKDIEEKMEKYMDENDMSKGNIVNVKDIIEQSRNIVIALQIFMYGFIIVITVIGLTNIFNTINTNVLSRKIEFASLASIGMTSKDFKKMRILESFFLGIKSLIIGIPLGLIFSYLIYYVIYSRIEMPYEIPVFPILFSIIFVFLIIWMIMKYSMKKINNLNIIETIRNENI